MSDFAKTIRFLAILSLALTVARPAAAQRPRFADPFQVQGNSIITAPQLPQLQAPQLPQIQAPQLPNFTPQNPPPGFTQGFPANGVLPTLDLPRTQVPDPSNYNLQPFPLFQNSTGVPRVNVLPPVQQIQQPVIAQPNFQQPILPQANFQQPNFQQPNFQQPNLGFQGNFNPAQSRWPYEGTGSNWLPQINWTWPQQQWQNFRTNFLPRLVERPRFRHTFLQGSNSPGVQDGNELDINDFELATTLTRPNFLNSGQPLRVSPGAVFSFWDGPDTPSTGFDLPNNAVGAYLAFDHVTDLTKTSGIESNVTVGIYSDYDNLSSDSFRITGRLLGWRRINPYIVGKLGVEYFDRIQIKLLPAAGLYIAPNPDMKFDLYFPRTKLSHRIPNIGDYEVWAHLGGEYGGGSWAIERIDGSDDQVDINDVRAFIGMEWIGPRRFTGFADFGYAFEREIVYRSDQQNELDLQDTLFVSFGLAF